MKPCNETFDLGLGMETAKRRFGEAATAPSDGEFFHCQRCGYDRPLTSGEDGLRIYILHEQRCKPVPGGQIWLPFINEDGVISSWPEDKRPPLRRSRVHPAPSVEQAGTASGPAGLPSRKAA